MAKVKKQAFDALFVGLEEVPDEKSGTSNTILFGPSGEGSCIIEIENPVQQLSTDADDYTFYHSILSNIMQILGEGFALQKQDIFSRQAYHFSPDADAEYLTRKYFTYFDGREYTRITTFLIVSMQPIKSNFIKYDPKSWETFFAKIAKITDCLKERGIAFRKLDKAEVNEYLHRFMAFTFREGAFSMTNFKASDEYLRTGDRIIRSFPLVDIDEINLPSFIRPYQQSNINGYNVATDVLSFLSQIPDTDLVVYNQVIQIPGQRALLRKLQQKAKRHNSMPDPSNKIAKADIDEVLAQLAIDSSLLVYSNFNIIVSCNIDKASQVSSFIETKLYDCGIIPSRTAYNQLELFCNSFPGRAYSLNSDYDLFLTLGDAALCLFFKEHLKHSEQTPLKIYYTDRQGLPVCIDITGKEGSVKMTDNANFFCIGPSGSGKSFHMNSVVRQLLEQGTEVVMVDTGDSYEGINAYFEGTYISYSKENPISMNPFKITDAEYGQNFGEKKNFLKSLIFLIYKGNEAPTKIEDKIINQTIVEYYDAYFNPFTSYTHKEREQLRQRLMLEDKRDGKYSQYEKEFKKQYNSPNPNPGISNDMVFDISEERAERRNSLRTKSDKLISMLKDANSTEGEKRNANSALVRIMNELMQDSYLIEIDRRIDDMEEKKRAMPVRELSFNSYYEYAIERIPQICESEKISFDINGFASILAQFYRGGELQDTLNSDIDASLFDERFIVFEVDKIKDDPVIFPIVVLIIMDVFLQKMRIKKGRKALIIEEAWKAIASPTMAEYIKYLYKTVRKFHGIAGVVTQELNDVIDSPIVKEAIINNSDVKILLDQSKFKDRYDDISRILGLTDVQKQQIFTINALPNHEGRNYFKEVWICRGQNSDVYGVEEPPECYWAYTTERIEKEALKIYRAYYGGFQDAIDAIEHDRKKSGISRYLDFARQVNQHQKVMSLW